MNSILPTLDSGCGRVVGTIITAEFLQNWRIQPSKLPCDLVELRVDGFPDLPGWLEIGQEVEGFDIPVFVTVRLQKEGGKWNGLDGDRWPFIEQALTGLSGVDVELESELAELAARLARESDKLCVLSHHDFQKTPPLPLMQEKIKRAHGYGAVAKLATTVNTEEDLRDLHALLAQDWPLPICLIGMGPLGRPTRLEFPKAGSCFTYGYLDTPGAPGQYSALELMTQLKRP